jgi:hypothetical protein
MVVAQSWWPIAVAACLGGSFGLWFALNDWERSRYFAIIAGLPVTVFAVVGIWKWQQEAKLKI